VAGDEDEGGAVSKLMRAHRFRAQVRRNEPLVVQLPEGTPQVEVEVIVLIPEPHETTQLPSLRSFDDRLRNPSSTDSTHEPRRDVRTPRDEGESRD
jgi:hypothetical protein